LPFPARDGSLLISWKEEQEMTRGIAERIKDFRGPAAYFWTWFWALTIQLMRKSCPHWGQGKALPRESSLIAKTW
jgi:hypothetical protein